MTSFPLPFKAQTELLAKVNRLTIPVRAFSIGSGVFLLVLVAMLIYPPSEAGRSFIMH